MGRSGSAKENAKSVKRVSQPWEAAFKYCECKDICYCEIQRYLGLSEMLDLQNNVGDPYKVEVANCNGFLD